MSASSSKGRIQSTFETAIAIGKTSREIHLDAAGVHSELDGIRCSSRPQVVHARFQALRPGVKMERRKLSEVGLVHVDVQALALINECSPLRSHIHNRPLLDFPDGSVNLLQVCRDDVYLLDRAVVINDLILQVLRPQAHVGQVVQKVLVHDYELTTASRRER